MTSNAFHNITQIESSLWEAADQLRANSKPTSNRTRPRRGGRPRLRIGWHVRTVHRRQCLRDRLRRVAGWAGKLLQAGRPATADQRRPTQNPAGLRPAGCKLHAASSSRLTCSTSWRPARRNWRRSWPLTRPPPSTFMTRPTFMHAVQRTLAPSEYVEATRCPRAEPPPSPGKPAKRHAELAFHRRGNRSACAAKFPGQARPAPA